MVEIGRSAKFYDMAVKQRVQVEQAQVSVIQGFLTSVDLYQKGILMQVDFVSRCLQQENILEYLQYMQDERYSQQEIKEELIGTRK
jgi:hypothetical protein